MSCVVSGALNLYQRGVRAMKEFQASRVAALDDIHGNTPAFAAVLAEKKRSSTGIVAGRF
jgi:hypothetical protein